MFLKKTILRIVEETYSEVDKNDVFKILDKYYFVDEYEDFYHGQHNHRVRMYDKKGGQLLAFALYSIYHNEVSIDIINAKVEGYGYGKIVMIFLAKKYGYENLERKTLTAAGLKMRKELDMLFNFDYEKHLESKSNHFPKSIFGEILIKHPIAGEFLADLYYKGQSETWEKWIKKIKENPELEDEYDFDSLAEIIHWVKGSATNDNPRFMNPPNHIGNLVNSLIK